MDLNFGKALNACLVCFSVLIISIFIFCCITDKKQKQYENSIQAYSYLSNYHVSSAICKTTLYSFHKSECSKKKSHPNYGVSFSGTRCVPFRTVAVDPEYIPLGSVLIELETGQVYIAEDTGNLVKGYAVDICIGEPTPEHIKAMNTFGSKMLMFFIIEPRHGKKLFNL